MAEINTDLKGPGSAISTSGAANQWVNPTNALVEDGSYATMVVPSSTTPADNARFELSSFGFDIPAPATITAIQFAVKTAIYNGTGGGATMNVKARLPAGTESTTTFSSGALTSDDTVYTFGGTSELWGGTWTPANINSSSFGCYVRTDGTGTTGVVSVAPPASATSEGGTVSWTGLTNLGASDDARATVTPPGSSATTPSDAPWLNVYFTSFSPPIPSNAIITGIAFDVERSRQAGGGTGNIIDDSARIMKAGVRTGSDLPKPSNWNATTDSPFSYGGIGNLWGLTWTPTDIATAGFGFSLRAVAVATTGNRQAAVDGVQCRVLYTVPSDQSVRIDSVSASVTYSGITKLSTTVTQTQTFDATATKLIGGSAQIDQTESVSAVVDRNRSAAATLAQTETWTGSANRTRTVAAQIDQTQTWAAAIGKLITASATISQTESLTAQIGKLITASATVSQAQTFAAVVSRNRGIAATIDQTQSLPAFAIARLRGVAATIVQTEGVTALIGRVRSLVATINETSTWNATATVDHGAPAKLRILVTWDEWVYTGTSFQLQKMNDVLELEITQTLEPSIMSLSTS